MIDCAYVPQRDEDHLKKPAIARPDARSQRQRGDEDGPGTQCQQARPIADENEMADLATGSEQRDHDSGKPLHGQLAYKRVSRGKDELLGVVTCLLVAQY